MNTAHCTLSFAALLFALAPLRTAEPQEGGAAKPASSAAQTAQELERKARSVLGDVVDKKADEIAQRLRGQAGATGQDPAGTDDEDEDVDEDADSTMPDDADELPGADDPVLARLTTIDDRLCTIEGLLLDLTARTATAPVLTAAVPVAPPVAPPVATMGSPVTTGFEKARVRLYINGTEATVKFTVNGMPAGRFDTGANLELAPFLQAGRMNQVAFTIEPRGKGDVSGVSVHVEAQMPGTEDSVAILQFQASKTRLTDMIEIPWAPR